MHIETEIDDCLMEQAVNATGERSRKAVLEAGLRMLLKFKPQTEDSEAQRRRTTVRSLTGKINFFGDYEQ